MRHAFALVLITAVAGSVACSNENKGGDSLTRLARDGDSKPGGQSLDPWPQGATINPYLTCRTRGGHDDYPLTIVQWVSWTDGITPMTSFRLDVETEGGSVKTFNAVDYPSSPVPGVLVFKFVKGRETIDYKFTSSVDGIVEISKNGGPRVTLRCGGSPEDNRVYPIEKIRERIARLGVTAWCDGPRNDVVEQVVFRGDGQLEAKLCQWDRGPRSQISSSVGRWSLDKRLHLTMEIGGRSQTYFKIGILNEEYAEAPKYLLLGDGDPEPGKTYSECRRCD